MGITSSEKSSVEAEVRMVWKLLDLRLAERSLEVGARRRYPCILNAVDEGEDEDEEEGAVEEEDVNVALGSLSRGVLALKSTESAFGSIPGPCRSTSSGPSPCRDPDP